jgi:hypothetical protein
MNIILPLHNISAFKKLDYRYFFKLDLITCHCFYFTYQRLYVLLQFCHTCTWGGRQWTTYRNLASNVPHMKKFAVVDRIRINNVEGQVIYNRRYKPPLSPFTKALIYWFHLFFYLKRLVFFYLKLDRSSGMVRN